MLLPQGRDVAVFDEFIRPADALDGGVDAGVVEVLDDRRAEAVEQDVVLEGAERPCTLRAYFSMTAVSSGLMKRGLMRATERPLASSCVFVALGHFEHGAEADERDVGAVGDDFGLADFEERGLAPLSGVPVTAPRG